MNHDHEKQVYISAYSRAGIEHRAAGGTGAPPAELIDRHLAEVNFELANANAPEHENRTAPALARTPEVPAPSLLDGVSMKNFRTLRTLDGNEHRAFARGQRMADACPRTGGIDLDGFGRGICAMITGQRRGNEAEVRALSESINTAGGVWIPEQLAAEMVDLARNKSRCFEAGTVALDMASESMRLVTLSEDPTIAEVGENAQISNDDPVFGSKLLVARKHGVIVRASNELLADGANVGTAITNALASAFAVYLDGLVLSYLFDESGVGETESVGQPDYDDLITARAAVSALNGTATACLLNPTTAAWLAKLKTSTTLDYLRKPPALEDLALLETNAVASTHCILGDFAQSVVGVRGGLSIEISREAGTSFEYDQTWIRLLWRGDVGVLRKHFHILDGLTY